MSLHTAASRETHQCSLTNHLGLLSICQHRPGTGPDEDIIIIITINCNTHLKIFKRKHPAYHEASAQ